MQQCRPLARIKLRSSSTSHLQPLPSPPRCILSTDSTSLQHGLISLPSTSPTSLSHSPAPLHRRWLSSLPNSLFYSPPPATLRIQLRYASSSRWTSRQSTDPYTRLAKVQNLKSRAAFKLLQINEKYRLFKRGQTVVDLGFAPGSWSQVAIDLVKPSGRVLGVDLIPAQPPKGVSAIQGDFLSADVQEEVRRFVGDSERGRLKHQPLPQSNDADIATDAEDKGYVDSSSHDSSNSYDDDDGELQAAEDGDEASDRCVDIVLSDMSEPWDMVDGHYKRTLSNPYRRMMNTSGNAFRDHVGSMVSLLCARPSSSSLLFISNIHSCSEKCALSFPHHVTSEGYPKGSAPRHHSVKTQTDQHSRISASPRSISPSPRSNPMAISC